MFPDTAALYFAAIEDQEYKDEKINCQSPLKLLTICASPYPALEYSLGECLRV